MPNDTTWNSEHASVLALCQQHASKLPSDLQKHLAKIAKEGKVSTTAAVQLSAGLEMHAGADDATPLVKTLYDIADGTGLGKVQLARRVKIKETDGVLDDHRRRLAAVLPPPKPEPVVASTNSVVQKSTNGVRAGKAGIVPKKRKMADLIRRVGAHLKKQQTIAPPPVK